MQRWEELAEAEPERVQLIKKAKVQRVNKEGNQVTGVTYTFNNEEITLEGPVILATGGYAADFGETSLLKKHRPDTFDLASTNGVHATGDGHKMLMEIGANGIDMDKVQVHPTGLVDPKDPGSKWKFLAAEGKFPQSFQVPGSITNIVHQLSAAREVSFSTTRANVFATISVTATTFPARCGKRRRPAAGLFASSLTPRPPTFLTSMPGIILAVVS